MEYNPKLPICHLRGGSLDYTTPYQDEIRCTECDTPFYRCMDGNQMYDLKYKLAFNWLTDNVEFVGGE